MLEKCEWEEFRNSGLLWWVNRTLHLFGWAIAIDFKDGVLLDVYPAKCKFRGFDESSEEEGFTKLTNHIQSQIPEMLEAIKD